MSPRATGLLVIAVLIAIVANASLFVVREDQTAVVLRLGKIEQNSDGTYKQYQPGLNVKTPFVTTVVKFDTRRQVLDREPEKFITNDTKNVTVDYYVIWRVKDAAQFYKATKGGNMKRAEGLIDSVAKQKLKNAFSLNKLASVVSQRGGSNLGVVREIAQAGNLENIDCGKLDSLQDDKSLKAVAAPAPIASAPIAQPKNTKQPSVSFIEEARNNVQAEALENYGVEVVDVRVSSVELPRSVTEAVYNSMKAERKRVANLFRSCGDEEARKIRANAEAAARLTVAEGEREAAETLAKGQARAAAIYATAYEDKEFYSFYRRMEAYKKTLAQPGNIMVIRPDSDFFSYLKSSTGKPAAAKAPRVVPAPSAVVNP